MQTGAPTSSLASRETRRGSRLVAAHARRGVPAPALPRGPGGPQVRGSAQERLIGAVLRSIGGHSRVQLFRDQVGLAPEISRVKGRWASPLASLPRGGGPSRRAACSPRTREPPTTGPPTERTL